MADSNPDIDAVKFCKQMEKAAHDGKLTIRKNGIPVSASEFGNGRIWSTPVRQTDVNTWLARTDVSAGFTLEYPYSVATVTASQRPAAPGVQAQASEPMPVTTGDGAHAFDGFHGWTEKQWKKPLGDKPNWLKACIAIPGVQGVSETRWNPVLIAAALVRDGHATVRNVRGRFQAKPQLMPWLDAWKTYETENLDAV